MKDVPNLGPAYSTSDRRRRWTLIAWLVGGFLVAYAYVFISATASDSEHLSGCQAVVSAVTSRHRLCDLGVRFPLLKTYYSVYICGVLDKREQDSVVGNLRTYHRASHIPKILVQFFEKENWRAWSDPKSGRRGG